MNELLRKLYLKKKEKDQFEIVDEFISNEDVQEFKEFLENKIKINDLIFRKKLFFLKQENLKKYENKIDCKSKELTEENLYEFLKEEGEKENSIEKKEDYLYKKIIALFYYDYLEKIAEPLLLLNEENNILKKEYKYIDEDDQYTKYNLISLNENRVIEKNTLSPNSYPQYINDKRLKKYIEIQHIAYDVLIFLNDLLEKKYIKNLSLKPNIYNKIRNDHLQVAYENKAFGKYFSFENFKDILPTKLYNMKNDELWIKIDEKNITFEELLKNFKIYEDYIVTQIVHCEYFEENQEYFIKHLDHEYIFYTLEEYEKRQNNINQKGNGHKRVKTFKIDNSKIPFILEKGDNFLLKILNEYFDSKDLLNEYFQNAKIEYDAKI